MTELTRQILRLDREIEQKLKAAEAEAEEIRRGADEAAGTRKKAAQACFDAERSARRDALEKTLRQAGRAAEQSLREREVSHRGRVDTAEAVQALTALAKEKTCR
jgi:hypothetical protein